MWQILLGGVTGFLGPIVNGWMEMKKEEAKARERALDRTHELAVMEKESEIAVKRLTVEQEIASEQAAHKSFDTSQIAGSQSIITSDDRLTRKQRGLVLWVEMFAKIIRPTTTVFYQVVMTGFVGYLGYVVTKSGGDFVSSEEARTLLNECIFTMLGMAETTLLWWYGVRGKSKKKE